MRLASPELSIESICAHQLFERRAAQSPDELAVVSGAQRLTYLELNSRANQVAAALRTAGVNRGTLVGIQTDRNAEMLISVLGILKSGAAYLPLDPQHPLERRQSVLADAGVTLVLTQVSQREQFPQRTICIEETADQSVRQVPQEFHPQRPACVLYTSGSTGRPKGVVLTQANLTHFIQSVRGPLNINDGDVCLHTAPLTFVMSIRQFLVPLVQGASVVVATAEQLRDPHALFRLLKDVRVTHLDILPSYLRQCLQSLNRMDTMARNELMQNSLRQVASIGEALPPDVAALWLQSGHPARLINVYGQTETTGPVAIHPVLQVSDGTAPSVAVGRPIPNMEIYVLDENLNEVTHGTDGEIYIGGEDLCQGYHQQPELTADKLLPNPFSRHPGARMYKTGDRGRITRDGVLEHRGRADHQVKVRGFRVELGEIEARLRAMPGIGECAVIARADGMGTQRLIGYVASRTSEKFNPADLRHALELQLPDYMVPSVFVELDALPRTSNGKLDRKALPEPAARTSHNYETPRNDVERTLAAIWSELLRIDQPGIRDSFFELGGHSLLATQLAFKIQDSFAVDLPLSAFYLTPTIAGVAEAVTRLKAQPEVQRTLPRITPDKAARHAPFPLTDVQQAYWIGRGAALELGNVSCHNYREIDALDLNLPRFERALQRLIDRHEMLRAVFLTDGTQQVLPSLSYKVKVNDLSDLTAAASETELERIRGELSHQVLPADRAPLFDIRVTKLAGGRTRVHIGFDLLISDSRSFQIFFGELSRLYHDPNAELQPLELSFRDYVLKLGELEQSELVQRSKNYWLKRLETLPPAPDLPLAKNPSIISRPEFERFASTLSAERWDALKVKAARANLTSSGVLLAAFSEVLCAWSKSPRFTLNLTLFNRLPLHRQVCEIVGDFTSLTLLGVDYANKFDFKTRAHELQQQLWTDLDQRHYNGVRVLRELARQEGGAPRATMPVVFTSLINMGGTDGQTPYLEAIGKTIYGISQTPQVWLDHQVREHGGALVFNWDAVKDLFPAGMMREMFAAYCRLLDELATDDARWLAAPKTLLSADALRERAAINTTAAPVPPGLLQMPFTAQVSLQNDSAAVITPTKRLSYAEVFRRANNIAHQLQRMGVQPNKLVAVVMHKGWEQVVAVLGVLQSGAAYVPIDAAQPSERLAYFLDNSQSAIALTTKALDAKLVWPQNVQRLCVDDEALAALNATPPAVQSQPTDLAYVIYTSGSTGQPKGVATDHCGALNTCVDINQRFKIGPQDRILALSNLNFDLSVYDIFGVLGAGGAIVLPEAESYRNPAHWYELLQREKITVWNTVPALLELMVDFAENSGGTLDSLRVVMLSGDWIPTNLPDRVRKLAPHAAIYSLGGATEASIWSILYPIERVDPNWKSIPYGRPMLNQSFHVLDHTLEPRPVWVPGMLYIGGIGLAQCYWRDESKTKASFIVHPRTGERLYRTGDLGRYLPDGNIEFLGREDLQVKINGYRIELGEIQSALEQHPNIRSAVVTAVGPRAGARKLAAYIVAEGNAVGEARLSQHAWDAMAEAARARAAQVPPTIEAMPEKQRRVERLATAYICRALRVMGVFELADEMHSAESLMQHLQIKPRFKKVFRQWLKILADDQLLEVVGPETYCSREPLPKPNLAALWKQARIVRSDWGDKWLDLLERSGENLPAILRGSPDPLELMYPAGDSTLACKHYENNPWSKYFNGVMAAILRSYLAQLPSSHRVRILEIGAGTGATTASLLPELDPACSEYVFTDVSLYFTNLAKQRFSAYPFVTFKLLDIDKDPPHDQFESHSFDVVVCSNVMHCAKNIRQALQHALRLLKPNGVFLQLEATQNTRAQAATVGLFDGFSRFEDERLHDNVPLLSPERWGNALTDAGFTDFRSFPMPSSPGAVLEQHVMIACAPAGGRAKAAQIDLEELRSFLRQKLPEYMLPATIMQLDALPLTPNGKVNLRALPVSEQPEQERACIAPRNETETLLARIWTEVLGQPRVGIHDNFLELGGDSILAIQVISKANQAGLKLQPADIFAYRTIAALAAAACDVSAPYAKVSDSTARKNSDAVDLSQSGLSQADLDTFLSNLGSI